MPTFPSRANFIPDGGDPEGGPSRPEGIPSRANAWDDALKLVLHPDVNELLKDVEPPKTDPENEDLIRTLGLPPVKSKKPKE